MATILLSAAGVAVGAAIGGPAAAAVGRAAGAMAGAVLDQRLLGLGARAVETEPLRTLRVSGAREGQPIPRVFGRARLAGAVVWATRFRVEHDGGGGGSKGGGARPAPESRRVSVSFALGLCEGPIDGVGRIWADGRLLAPDAAVWRLHRGTEEQAPDPLIEAVEGPGLAPAYRGLAYVVFEDLALGPFGDRVPQIDVEVFRAPRVDRARHPGLAPPIAELVRGVALSPGSGEFSLETTPVLRRLGPGVSVWENRSGREDRADLVVALDQLQAMLPACRSVSLIVSWFGDDLRCGRCAVYPAVEEPEKETAPVAWRVAGLSRDEARVTRRTAEGRPAYGGTPSDAGVIAAIREIRRRGLKVMVYPFLLMDVAPEDGKPDPWGDGVQPAFPWRGRITLDRAPGRPGSADASPGAADEVARFFGAARAADFTVAPGAVGYDGPDELSYRRFVLHCAALAAAAGGVDAFCVGSELRGLTRIRSSRRDRPAVEALRALAAEARALLGQTTKIGYAADWSEYGAHLEQDGSGDLSFPLDPLWADPEIDFVGVDWYPPLTDWRDGDDHLDAAGARSIQDRAYLRARIEGGEGYDWFYATDADRAAQRRSPIADAAHGEHWVFRPKDLRGWWSSRHHERRGGAREATPTAWVPRSKPVWLTEIGCGAIDKGPNQPSVFADPKSVESGAPWFSSGARDDAVQRRFLETVLAYWAEAGANPVSPVYGGPMIDLAATHVWTWDARPWPAFPEREAQWSDGANWATGHWIQGRVASAGLAEVVAEICAAAGVPDADVSDLEGLVDGYALEETQSARQALQPLMLAYGFDAIETGGTVAFRMRRDRPALRLSPDDLLEAPEDPALGPEFAREASDDAPAAVRLGYPASEGAYEPAAAEARPAGAAGPAVECAVTTLAMSEAQAQAVVDRWAAEATRPRATVRFGLPPSRLALEPADVVAIGTPAGSALARVERIEEGGGLRVTATLIGRTAAAPAPARPSRRARRAPETAPAPLAVELLALPEGGGAGGLRLAAFGDPWPGAAAVWRSATGEDWRPVVRIERPAVMGALVEPLAAAAPHRWSRGPGALVRLHGGALRSAAPRAVLDGANLAAIAAPGGGWELIQFTTATLVAPDLWRLDDLLRGQAGTEAAIGDPTPAGARFVLLDGAPAPLPWSPADRGLARRWRVGPVSAPLGDRAQVEIAAAIEPVWLAPRAPARLTAAWRADGALAARWTPRDALDADTWSDAEDFDAAPAQRFRVRLLASGDRPRVFFAEGPSLTLSAAALAAAGLAAPFDLAVAALAPGFGPGPESRISIDARHA